MEKILDLILRFLRWLLGIFFPQTLQQQELPPLKRVAELPFRIAPRDTFDRPDLPDERFIALIPYDNGRGQRFELVASSHDEALLQRYCDETQVALTAQDTASPADRRHLSPVEQYVDKFRRMVEEKLSWEPTRDPGAIRGRIEPDELSNRLIEVWTQLKEEVGAAEVAHTLTSEQASQIRDFTETMVGRINQQRTAEPPPAEQVNVRIDWINRPAGGVGERPFLLRFKIDPALTDYPQWGSVNSYWRGDITWASVSIFTTSGAVGVSMYCNGLWVSGGSAASAISNALSSFSLTVIGQSPNPNIYTMTGTWEAF